MKRKLADIKIRLKHALLILLLVAGGFVLCKRQKPNAISFYYWRVTYSPDRKLETLLNDNQVKQLYVRYFDVVVNDRGQAVPESPLSTSSSLTKLNVIPVVFIKNNVFEQTPVDSVASLSRHVVGFIRQMNHHFNQAPSEIQFDCDWTLKTRDRFFLFLKACKKNYPVCITATIRLHQVKFFTQTGVPPVDKGMLMYYNMGEIASDTLNSIYDRSKALNYIASLRRYPLKLDVALPVYSWGIRIVNGEVTQLLSKLHREDFVNNVCFKEEKQNQFITLKACFLHGFYFKVADRIKIEFADADQLLQMADDISENLKSKADKIVFFDLDTLNTQRYEKDVFRKVACRFR